jgi:5-methylcytosine-specific restriction endonuclease McrA
MGKTCLTCGEHKNHSEFERRTKIPTGKWLERGSDGYRNHCIKCVRERAKKYQFTCIICNVVFNAPKANHRHRRLYCSPSCQGVGLSKLKAGSGLGKFPRQCIICGATFLEYPSTIKSTCSNSCNTKRRSLVSSGERSHFWRGGKATQVEKFRHSYEYRAWRKSVYERDDYTCQICGTRGGKLNGHHIKIISLYPEHGLDVGNGITLCRECHNVIKGDEPIFETWFFGVTGGLKNQDLSG